MSVMRRERSKVPGVDETLAAGDSGGGDGDWVASAEPSLFEQLGGDPAIAAVVDDFYQRVLADPLLAPVFARADMQALKKHQRRFMTYVLGGTFAYSGQGMRRAHGDVVKRYGIDDRHFDAVIGHLSSALLAQGVPQPLTEPVIAIAETTRADVLGR